MEFKVEKAVLDAGVKIVFVVIQGLDNSKESYEWHAHREVLLNDLLERYKDVDVHQDPILEGLNLLHDHTGVKRRKNIPASENLIKLLQKHGSLTYINKVVDIYNLISLDSKLALGAHNIDRVSGNVTLRFTDGTERFVPLGQTEPVAINPHEYSYIDDSNEVLCRLEIRQVQKTLVDETARNVFYIVQGNDATSDELLHQTAQKIIDLTTQYCGGVGEIIIPTVV
jgi:DNA/RNA-binding domain of Phe-tRNA-synthetase-like protein